MDFDDVDELRTVMTVVVCFAVVAFEVGGLAISPAFDVDIDPLID